ncbi:putative methyltransferase [Niemeyer virus]|uniref:Uncharacterized protein L320 n=8 Tax=Mimivirus TaxID=315393 RepID=YL320_MIMIV|nr:putative methyltransferase [Acanthamoeba polyphaga mimivirus]Q5UQR2.1 RecName: Full=Uncharacterized protein L320 [Acanthamoeba polyphaga mimivirus]ALR83900.1 putative methyltransferase [Niemeyer virus]AAV50589.1 unknown [Acanthamoeba polyphaga mimivirus]ADO18138.1 putative methyltransferase [Acanthamoeba polyphaga mimivirus]UTE96181.1 putative methyltransferase MIMI-L320 [Acanthamoeba polyphaga mimivirus]
MIIMDYYHMDIILYPNKNLQKSLTKRKCLKQPNIHSIKRLIFPPITETRLSKIMIDDESIKYITYNSSAQEITNIIMNNLENFPCPSHCSEEKWRLKSPDQRMKKLVITEMTAGVGGNVLNFAKYFKYVNAIELNCIRYKYLNNNIKLYDYSNVNCYNDNSVSLLIEKDDLGQDIVFFDPPWGGGGYKQFQNLRLDFDKYSVEVVCQKLLEKNHNKMVILKLPSNYDFDYFFDQLKSYTINKFDIEKMTIIVVKKY